jgi:hypothetical protein
MHRWHITLGHWLHIKRVFSLNDAEPSQQRIQNCEGRRYISTNAAKKQQKNKTHLMVTNHFGYLQTLGSMQLSSRKALGSGLDELEVYMWR